MTISAKLQDGRTLNFPDGTNPDVIQATVKRLLSAPQETPGQDRFQQAQEAELGRLAEETAAGPGGFLRTGAILTGAGLTKIGRALGLVDPADETELQAIEALRQERPVTAAVGEAVGEALPFAAAPIGAITATPARIAASAVLGGIESGLVKRGERRGIGEQAEAVAVGGGVAGAVEASLPFIGRIGGKLIRKVFGRAPKSSIITPDGLPTDELSQALDKAGLTFEDVKEGVKGLTGEQVKGTPVEQKLRQALFKELEIPATRGDITQEFGQQAAESRLLESAADPLSDPLRARALEKGRAVKTKLDSLVDEAGIPEDVGASIKDALSGRKALLKKEKSALYKKAAESAENPGSLPFPTDAIESAIPNARTMREIRRIEPGKFEALKDLLSEFGIDKSPEGLQRLEDEGIEALPLSVDNFDEFRKSLNRLMDVPPGAPNPLAVIAGPIKDALDNEADNLVEIFTKAGVDDATIQTLGEARATVRKLKTEFSPQAVTGKLINVKRDGFTPVTEASKVFNEIVGTNKPIEVLKRTITSLKKSGPKGIKAIGDLQAATIVDLIESAFKAEGRKIQGEKVFGNLPFNKRFNQIGEDKLNLIFSTNKPLLSELKKINKAVRDLVPPSGAIPKGSASVILDTLNKAGIMSILGKVPGGGLLAEGVTRLSEGSATRAAVKRALEPGKINPAIVAGNVLPSLAAALTTKIGIEGDTNAQK